MNRAVPIPFVPRRRPGRAARAGVVTCVAVAVGWCFGRADAQHPPAPLPQVEPPRATPGAARAGEGHHEEGEPSAFLEGAAAAPAHPATKPTMLRVAVPAKDGMLRMPGGRFFIGAGYTAVGAKVEQPIRPIVLAPYWIDRTEVTVGDYRTCVARGACDRPAKTSASCTYDLGDPDLPVSCVHWADAEAYCKASTKRMPTEAEWEHAARGTQSVTFPWGGGAGCAYAVTMVNEMPDRSCAPHPAKVGTHPRGASMFGVEDLAGNVEEWTSDWYSPSVGRGPAPRAGSSHVLRGGGWLSNPSMSRTTSRNWGSAMEAGANVGFRCARDD